MSLSGSESEGECELNRGWLYFKDGPQQELAPLHEAAPEPIVSAVAHRARVSQDAFCYYFHCMKIHGYPIDRFKPVAQ